MFRESGKWKQPLKKAMFLSSGDAALGEKGTRKVQKVLCASLPVNLYATMWDLQKAPSHVYGNSELKYHSKNALCIYTWSEKQARNLHLLRLEI